MGSTHPRILVCSVLGAVAAPRNVPRPWLSSQCRAFERRGGGGFRIATVHQNHPHTCSVDGCGLTHSPSPLLCPRTPWPNALLPCVAFSGDLAHARSLRWDRAGAPAWVCAPVVCGCVAELFPHAHTPYAPAVTTPSLSATAGILACVPALASGWGGVGWGVGGWWGAEGHRREYRT